MVVVIAGLYLLGLPSDALLRADLVEEAREQVVAVVRAGRGFGVVLHREDRLAVDAEAGIGAVEQRDVGLA